MRSEAFEIFMAPLLPLSVLGAIALVGMELTREDTPAQKSQKAAVVAQDVAKATELFRKNGFEIVGQMNTSGREYCFTLRKPANAAFNYTGCYWHGTIRKLSAIEAKPAPAL